MFHSITFSKYDSTLILAGKNTWDDWMLAPSSRPVFNPPALKEHIIDIPGKDGVLDLSESLCGFPMYERREGTVEFYVINEYGSRKRVGGWQDTYSTIMEFMHGRVLRAILEDDPNYFYKGRFFVQEWKSEKDYSMIIIGYKVDPYKWEIQTSSQKWPNQFTGTVQYNSQRTMVVNRVYLGQASVFPIISLTGNAGDMVDVHYSSSYSHSPDLNRMISLETGGSYEIQDALLNKTFENDKTFLFDTSRYASGSSLHVNTGPINIKIDIRRGYL